MLQSKLTSGAAKPLTPEGVLPMGPRSVTDGRPSCLSLVPYPERYRLSLGVRWTGLLRRCLPHRQRWIVVPQSGLTNWYMRREM
jgi:hypothetical protein